MAEHVRVRMYNVGFGDWFLIEFPTDGPRPFRVLVDCGAHSSGYPRDGWKPEDAADQIITDVSDGADPHIDVVVATHRHQDHVSGFEAEAWGTVSVGEVWMPWTEHPTDAKAASIRRRQLRLASGLVGALEHKLALGMQPAKVQPLLDLVTNSLSNEAAMRTLHRGFRGRPKHRFLSTGRPAVLAPEDLPGLTVHVLGPSRDEKVIRDMDPPAGQSYLRFVDGGPAASDATAAHRPFGRQFSFDEASYVANWANLALDPAIKQSAADMTEGDDVAAAVAIDKAVNGTSLMLMFEFGDAYLLFPGDAQWGTWHAALDDPEHRALMERTTFLKVGHHGSHNATPKELLEDVLDGRKIWGAATSVHPIDQWPQIPKDELMDRLAEKATRVRRSDKPGQSGRGVTVRRGVGVDFAVPC